MKPKILLAALAAVVTTATGQSQVLISGYMANPAGTDSPFEYVQLVAANNIDFSVTPMSVVFSDNGTATANGWAEGNNVTYKFNLSSGTVTAGSVFYVGGSGRTINGTGTLDISGQSWIRFLNTGTVAGDGFGNARTGVLGNGGVNADGIAIFNTLTPTASTTPTDAIFFGSGIGTALVSSGTQGYQLPSNDRYSGGKLQSTTFLFSDPAGSDYTRLTGSYHPSTGQWTTARTSSLVSGPTTLPNIDSQITLVPEPSAFTLMGLTMIAFLGRSRRSR